MRLETLSSGLFCRNFGEYFLFNLLGQSCAAGRISLHYTVSLENNSLACLYPLRCFVWN